MPSKLKSSTSSCLSLLIVLVCMGRSRILAQNATPALRFLFAMCTYRRNVRPTTVGGCWYLRIGRHTLLFAIRNGWGAVPLRRRLRIG